MSREPESAVRGRCCPEDEDLAAYADGRLDAAGRSTLAAHLAICRHCLLHVGLLAKLADQPPHEVPLSVLERAARLAGPSKPERSGWRWPWTVVPVAAAVCVVAAISPVLRRSPAPPPITVPEVRQTPVGATRPEILGPGWQEGEIRWRGMSGVLSYQVRVLTAEGDEVWSGRTDATSLRLPGSVALVPGRRYYVWVSAFLPDGKTTKSDPAGFVYQP